jgi:hypothetical protein
LQNLPRKFQVWTTLLIWCEAVVGGLRFPAERVVIHLRQERRVVEGLEGALLALALIVLVEEMFQAPVITLYRIGKVDALSWVLDLNLSEGILLRPLATMFMRRAAAEDGGVVQVDRMTSFQDWDRTEAQGAAGLLMEEGAFLALGGL